MDVPRRCPWGGEGIELMIGTGRRSVAEVIREAAVCASVAAFVLAVGIYGIVRFVPPPRPSMPAAQTAALYADVTLIREGSPRNAPSHAPRPEVGIGAAVEIDAAAHLGEANALINEARNERSLLCRVSRYCEARQRYQNVVDTLAQLDPCSPLCAEMTLQAEARRAALDAPLAPVAASIGCSKDLDVCACVALNAGSACRQRKTGSANTPR